MIDEINDFKKTRVFADQLGNQVRAEFLRLTDGKVRLRTLEGKLIVLPLSELTEEDQAWIKNKVKELRSGGSKPKEDDQD